MHPSNRAASCFASREGVQQRSLSSPQWRKSNIVGTHFSSSNDTIYVVAYDASVMALTLTTGNIKQLVNDRVCRCAEHGAYKVMP